MITMPCPGKKKWYDGKLQVKGGTYYLSTTAISKTKARSNLKKRLKGMTDAKVEVMTVFRRRKK